MFFLIRKDATLLIMKVTLHRLEAVLEGDLAEMIDALIAYDQAELLKEDGENG